MNDEWSTEIKISDEGGMNVKWELRPLAQLPRTSPETKNQIRILQAMMLGEESRGLNLEPQKLRDLAEAIFDDPETPHRAKSLAMLIATRDRAAVQSADTDTQRFRRLVSGTYR